MKTFPIKIIAATLLCFALAFSFWYSHAWLQLCYGLALFLFGMQCIEDGLHNAAGGTLEKLMEHSTATPSKGLMFGIGATFILQSTTLVSLLTIAFLSTGLIKLAGGIAILLGTNLGATSGIWLLAIAGQSISLSPVAVPMLVFGILASFFNSKTKAIGRVLIGISLIFLGIDAIKSGFQGIGDTVDFANFQVHGAAEIAIFCIIGLILTLVLQSTHATLILTLAALAGGQINVMQAFAIAIGSNVGSSVTTALVGMLGSDRNGQRLALAHLLFNVITAALSLLLWWPLSRLVVGIASWTNISSLLQLALFHTLFNLLGLALFWPLQKRLATKLKHWLPSKQKNESLPVNSQAVLPQYLNDNVLHANDTAIRAVFQEIRHLNGLGLEVICHALFVPTEKLHNGCDKQTLSAPSTPLELNVQSFYEWQIKPLYSDILTFSSKINVEDEVYREQLNSAYHIAFRMVEAVKDSKHLQKNMQHFLSENNGEITQSYLHLREHLLRTLCQFRTLIQIEPHDEKRIQGENALNAHAVALEQLKEKALQQLRDGVLNSWQISSLLNDINYARMINEGLLDILQANRRELLPCDE